MVRFKALLWHDSHCYQNGQWLQWAQADVMKIATAYRTAGSNTELACSGKGHWGWALLHIRLLCGCLFNLRNQCKSVRLAGISDWWLYSKLKFLWALYGWPFTLFCVDRLHAKTLPQFFIRLWAERTSPLFRSWLQIFWSVLLWAMYFYHACWFISAWEHYHQLRNFRLVELPQTSKLLA